MNHYYYENNRDESGNHIIHSLKCKCLPAATCRNYIGFFFNCSDAINQAKQKNPSKSFDGCYLCCKYHKS